MTTKNKIELTQFEEWARTTEIEYAAESVTRKSNPAYRDRLRFLVVASGGFKVTLGNKTLYQGDCFDYAATAYHEAV